MYETEDVIIILVFKDRRIKTMKGTVDREYTFHELFEALASDEDCFNIPELLNYDYEVLENGERVNLPRHTHPAYDVKEIRFKTQMPYADERTEEDVWVINGALVDPPKILSFCTFTAEINPHAPWIEIISDIMEELGLNQTAWTYALRGHRLDPTQPPQKSGIRPNQILLLLKPKL